MNAKVTLTTGPNAPPNLTEAVQTVSEAITAGQVGVDVTLPILSGGAAIDGPST